MAGDDQLTVTIDADIDNFIAGVERVRADFAALGDSMKQVAADMEGTWQQHQQKLVQAQQQGTQQMNRQTDQLKHQWATALHPLESSLTQAVNGMIKGTETFQQAILKIGQSIVLGMVDNVIKKIVEQWIAGELAKSAVTGIESTARATTQATSAEAGAAAESAVQKKSILGHAASGAAAVYDDVAQIPYVGWLLAPAAAAAAFAAILAFGGNIPSFDTGAWNIPSDTLAMVHQGETILPAGLAANFRAAVAGGSGGSGGDVYSITIQALDTQTGAQFLKNNIGVIVSGLQQQVRNGALKMS